MAWLIAALALLVLGPLVAWAGRSQGKRIKGGLSIALLGIGAVFDPPRRHDLEVHKREERESPSPREPDEPEED
jgi:hypothetical protein